MVARLDWLNNNIDRMLIGKRPVTPEDWGSSEGIRSKDVDMLRCAAELNSVRDHAAEPSASFLSSLRQRMLDAVDEEGSAAE